MAEFGVPCFRQRERQAVCPVGATLWCSWTAYVPVGIDCDGPWLKTEVSVGSKRLRANLILNRAPTECVQKATPLHLHTGKAAFSFQTILCYHSVHAWPYTYVLK